MNDIARLRNEYDDRKLRFAHRDVYSWFNEANFFAIQSRQRAVLEALRKHGFTQLSDSRILDMGCGDGRVLAEYLPVGASPKKLFGVDLLFERLVTAHDRLPGSSFANADGSHLPFPAHSFDLILQYTALSSILDADLRQDICHDMLRVLRPFGLILSFDFWLNPTNPQTHGIRPAEIRCLFPNCTCEFQRIILAPPISRRIVPVSWMLALLLENVRLLNTHYLAIIRPK